MHDLSNWNLLIVDDEPDNLGVLELVFRFHKAKVRVAASGPDCLQMLENEDATLLMLDIQMPGMSGFDLIKVLRGDERYQHLPIIAVSAHAMAGDSERAIEAGFDGYITKPISAMTLVDEVKGILSTKQQV
ncbi:MAG: response regulator [Anaerolineae bacterium]|nr:response regulator [Anaerolineae bacterium]